MGAKVRSTVQWLEKGEKLTCFFFHLEKECNEKYEIILVGNSQGVKVSSSAAIKQLHMDFNGNLLAVENRDLKTGRRDELGRLPEVNLHNRACAQELLPRVFAVVVYRGRHLGSFAVVSRT